MNNVKLNTDYFVELLNKYKIWRLIDTSINMRFIRGLGIYIERNILGIFK